MRTTYKTLCTVFNLFMLHDYMVCYHVVLTIGALGPFGNATKPGSRQVFEEFSSIF